MPAPTSSLKPDIRHIVAWSVALPILGAWPFLSAMPAFTLMGGDLSSLAISINVLMFLTGFWPLIAGWAALAILRTEVPLQAGVRIKERGLLIGIYAALWTAIYLIVVFARP
jgi:hypothetical protein